MKDLEPELKENVVQLCQKGVEQAEIERYEASNRTFTKVYALLPEPKSEWKAYTWLRASMADNCFELKDYKSALELLQEVIGMDSQYQENAYVRMRKGQCQYELYGEKEAVEELKLAYRLGGEEIFEDEYVKYKKIALKA